MPFLRAWKNVLWRDESPWKIQEPTTFRLLIKIKTFLIFPPLKLSVKARWETMAPLSVLARTQHRTCVVRCQAVQPPAPKRVASVVSSILRGAAVTLASAALLMTPPTAMAELNRFEFEAGESQQKSARNPGIRSYHVLCPFACNLIAAVIMSVHLCVLKVNPTSVWPAPVSFWRHCRPG